MANYNDTLQLYKQLQKNGAEHVDANLSTPTVLGSSIEDLDEAVYGTYEGGEDEQSEGQKRLIETMKEIENGNLSDENRKRIEENITNSKMPSAILQEMVNNPLIYTKVEGDDIDEFANRVLKSSAGIQKSSKIIERVEKEDNKKREERKQQQNIPNYNNVAQIDYDKISEIVESIVSTKFAEFEKKSRLNESKNPISNVKFLQLKENGSFLMVDTDDNVYECTLKYKGKNKRRN